jgi:hypothetical protein
MSSLGLKSLLRETEQVRHRGHPQTHLPHPHCLPGGERFSNSFCNANVVSAAGISWTRIKRPVRSVYSVLSRHVLDFGMRLQPCDYRRLRVGVLDTNRCRAG